MKGLLLISLFFISSTGCRNEIDEITIFYKLYPGILKFGAQTTNNLNYYIDNITLYYTETADQEAELLIEVSNAEVGKLQEVSVQLDLNFIYISAVIQDGDSQYIIDQEYVELSSFSDN